MDFHGVDVAGRCDLAALLGVLDTTVHDVALGADEGQRVARAGLGNGPSLLGELVPL